MNDDRVDALVRLLETRAEPDPVYVHSSLPKLLRAADDARRSDRRPLAWLREAVAGWSEALRTPARPMRMPVALIVLLLLLLVLGVIAVEIGSLRKPVELGGPSGLIAIADYGRLEVIDIETATTVDLLPTQANVEAVSRSPDGRLISYRIGNNSSMQHLEVMGTDGSGRRVVAPGVTFHGESCNDIWSPDSRWLVAGIRVATSGGDTGRILVVDTATGASQFVTDETVDAGCPIWSPDSEWVAYMRNGPAGNTIAIDIVRRDGTDRSVVTSDVAGGLVSWSRDGWLYYGAEVNNESRIYRANVQDHRVEPLTARSLEPAYAPALSPDGRLLSFTVARDSEHYDLYVADPDGSSPRIVLANATTNGWSTDGRYLLATWLGPGNGSPGGLTIVRPDGSGVTVLRPFSLPVCPATLVDERCFSDIGWGQSRP